MSEELEEELKVMLVDRLFLDISPEEIESEVPLMETYGVDSVSLLEMLVGIEEKYGLSLEDGDFEISRFETVAAMAEYVRSKMKT
ncbi:MAG: acyl carrier protein [Planctomycetes bacterium]|nr:acyl carrier protein [Planctomycetota bacterium]